MKEIILGVLAVAAIGTTLALCRAAGKADKSLEHPERLILRRRKYR